MLQLTKRTEYGLIALVHMVDRRGEFVSAREISEHYHVPRRLLAEVLKELCRADLIDSLRGASGGYSLARDPESVTLGQVVTAMEGRPVLSSCESLGAALRGGDCDVEHVCPIRSPLQRVRESIWHMLERTTLRALASEPLPIPAMLESVAPAPRATLPDSKSA